jgi:hypothetical protein
MGEAMWKKIWQNRLEFYPYAAILFFWFFGSLVQSLTLIDRPCIVALGLITILPVGLISLAMFRTYQTLPEKGTLPGPGSNG